MILVGGKSSGKTTYLSAFMHEYLKTLKMQKNLTLETYPEDKFDELEKYFKEGLNESTNDKNAIMYSIVQHKGHSNYSHQLAIYDIAGEVFTDQKAEGEQEQYSYCEAILFIVDPLSTSVARRAYTASHNEDNLSYYYSSVNFNDVVTGFIREFHRIGYLKPDKLSDIPVCVIITKSDVDVVSKGIGINYIKEDMTIRDKQCHDYLLNIGLSDALNNLEAQFSTIHYFPVSAMGHESSSENESYKPWGVMEPVSWILKNYDKDVEPSKVRRIAKLSLTTLVFLVITALYCGVFSSFAFSTKYWAPNLIGSIGRCYSDIKPVPAVKQ
jgi:GTPase SAR1 family protein